MTYYIVGLGNPGEEYVYTRHNTGRIILEQVRKHLSFSEWTFNKKLNALVSEGKVGKDSIVFILPETFMNGSGKSVAPLVGRVKKAEKLVVVHDEIDLPLGKMKIVFGRGSGGHRGVESIMKSIKTKDFVRIRVGISAQTPGGKLKKPKGEEKVVGLILGAFKDSELLVLKKIARTVEKVVRVIAKDGRERAMNEFN